MDAYGKTFGELEDIAQKWQAAFDAAERQAEKTKTAAGEGDGVKYSLKNTSDKTVVSIKQQIANANKTLNDTEPVVQKNVSEIFSEMNIKQKRAWAEKEALKYGNRVDRQGYGEIEVSRKDVNSALNYLQSDGEIAAFAALPYVLKRGKEIYREADHKGRGYSTVTFAAPVVINGVRGNMAVVVRETSKNHYDMHRIVMPDGSAFTFAEKTNAETGPTAATSSTDALTQPTASTSKNSIPADGENVKPQFSLKAPVEETKNLLALHNLTEKNLLDAAKLGGLPMPSIAIVKADEGHGEYGDISFVFSKDTIDPQLFRSNKVYGYDAWTPTAPRIEYEVNEKSAKKIHDLFYRMERAKGRSFADPLYSAANTLEDELNRKGGVDKIISSMRDDPRVMNIYLEDTGRGAVENVMKREVTRMDDNQQEMASFLIRELGESTVNDFRAKGGESPIAARKLWYKEHGEALNAALQKYYEKLGLPAKDAADVVNAETFAAKMRYLLDARKYLDGNTETVTEEVDRDAINKAIRDKVNQKEYEQWLDDLFDGVVKNEGIYNGKDYYTSSGNRRSFSATHYEITLENIVKAMKQGDQKGANTFFGGQAIWGVASKDYGSIDEIKADSGRLQKMTEEEYSAIRQKYSERLAELTNEIKDPAAKNEFIASDDAASANVKGNITLVGRIPYAKDIISILQGYTVDRMDAGAVDDIVRATKSMISSANGQGKKTAAYNVKQFLTVVSKIFGVSVANLGRDTWAIARSIASETGNVRLMFEMEKAIYRMDKSAGNRKTWCELLYRAQKDRDTETARLIYREMLAHGYEEADVRQGVEAIMKQEQGVNSVKELRNRWMAP